MPESFLFVFLWFIKEPCTSLVLADSMFFKAMSKHSGFANQLGLLLETEATPFPSSSPLVSIFQISLLVQRGFSQHKGMLVLTPEVWLTVSCNNIFKSFIKPYLNLSFISWFSQVALFPSSFLSLQKSFVRKPYWWLRLSLHPPNYFAPCS